MRVTVKIDPYTCIAAANCVGIAPRLFQIGAETHVELLDREGKVRGTEYSFEATPEELELIHEAVDSCPTRAITLIEGR